MPTATRLAASSAKVSPLAIRESVFWSARHLIIPIAFGKCFESSNVETASRYNIGGTISSIWNIYLEASLLQVVQSMVEQF